MPERADVDAADLWPGDPPPQAGRAAGSAEAPLLHGEEAEVDGRAGFVAGDERREQALDEQLLRVVGDLADRGPEARKRDRLPRAVGELTEGDVVLVAVGDTHPERGQVIPAHHGGRLPLRIQERQPVLEPEQPVLPHARRDEGHHGPDEQDSPHHLSRRAVVMVEDDRDPAERDAKEQDQRAAPDPEPVLTMRPRPGAGAEAESRPDPLARRFQRRLPTGHGVPLAAELPRPDNVRQAEWDSSVL